MHPAVGRTISDSSLTSLRDSIYHRLPFQATVLEYADLIYPLIDTVQCGHIGMRHTGAHWRLNYLIPGHTFPLSLKQLDDGRVVVSAIRADQDSVFLGAEVLNINGQFIDDIIDEVTVFSSGSDGKNLSGAHNRAISRIPFHLRWTLGKQDSFKIAIRIGSRDTLVTFLSKATTGAKKLDAIKQREDRKRVRIFNYGFDESRKTAVIDINSIMGYDPFNLIYPLALRGVLMKARKDSAQRIILDLRNNGGGRASNVGRIVSFFAQEETKIYEPWSFPKSTWLSAGLRAKFLFAPSLLIGNGENRRFGRLVKHKVKPRKKSFDVELIVLINSSTFSAASITASILKSSGRATLMGQESGGNYHETYAGIFSPVGLRRTGLMIHMPHLLIPSAVDESKQPFGKTLQPDIEVPITIEDVLDPRDRLLLRALEFSNN